MVATLNFLTELFGCFSSSLTERYYLIIEALTVGGFMWMFSLPPTSNLILAVNLDSFFRTCGGCCSTINVLQ
jgi:hypothetical protein